jgi:hypothetical protein
MQRAMRFVQQNTCVTQRVTVDVGGVARLVIPCFEGITTVSDLIETVRCRFPQYEITGLRQPGTNIGRHAWDTDSTSYKDQMDQKERYDRKDSSSTTDETHTVFYSTTASHLLNPNDFVSVAVGSDAALTTAPAIQCRTKGVTVEHGTFVCAGDAFRLDTLACLAGKLDEDVAEKTVRLRISDPSERFRHKDVSLTLEAGDAFGIRIVRHEMMGDEEGIDGAEGWTYTATVPKSYHLPPLEAMAVDVCGNQVLKKQSLKLKLCRTCLTRESLMSTRK